MTPIASLREIIIKVYYNGELPEPTLNVLDWKEQSLKALVGK
jgi:hypothetical protein